jgi:hypothetical protein
MIPPFGVALSGESGQKRPMRTQLGMATAALTVMLSLSGSALAGDPAEEQIVDQDPSKLPPHGTSSRLLLTGAAVTVGWYGAAVGTSYLWSDSPSASRLRIPVVGPTLALTKTGCGNGESSCNTFTVVLRSILTTLSAVGQVGGLVIMGEALFLPAREDVARDAGQWRLPARNVAKKETATLHAFPLVTEEGALGIGVAGAF